MIANYRNGFVWEVMKRNQYIRLGLERAGFTGGWLAGSGESKQSAPPDADAAAARAMGMAESRATAADETEEPPPRSQPLQ